MDNNDLKISIIENGIKKEYDILFTFRCEELEKDYIAFTDHSLDLDGNEKVIISYYDPDSYSNELRPVTDEEELKMANDVLAQILES